MLRADALSYLLEIYICIISVQAIKEASSLINGTGLLCVSETTLHIMGNIMEHLILHNIISKINHKTECFMGHKKTRNMPGFMPFIRVIILRKGGDNVAIQIDFNNINDDIVYEAFGVDGNEAEALNDIYLELFELIGKEAMLKLFKHFRGDKVDCPIRLYRPEFITDKVKNVSDRRERARIARAGGYTAKAIENMLSKCRTEGDGD